ncbi:MAG: DmsC/YnfH family molybdoenzyme membrane anchor subunit, partial [Pseudomonadota bacterium]
MHPAYSVILFTTSSGAGYGLLFWLSLAHAIGFAPDDRWLLFTTIALALILITVGLLASTLHLGHPERALGAFSQWRSSWLSREGVIAILTYAPAVLLALFWFFGAETGLTALLALLAAIGAGITVYCTGMIYASLRTIRQWHKPAVPYIYIALAACTGALLLGLLIGLFGHAAAWPAILALLCLGAAAFLKMQYWQTIDADKGLYTAEMATGLGSIGKVKPLDPPHTRPNFVMREMGYRIARKHALKLRQAVLLALFVAPTLLVLIALLTGWSAFLFALAVIAAGIGV